MVHGKIHIWVNMQSNARESQISESQVMNTIVTAAPACAGVVSRFVWNVSKPNRRRVRVSY
jgi:hypothetical protein